MKRIGDLLINMGKKKEEVHAEEGSHETVESTHVPTAIVPTEEVAGGVASTVDAMPKDMQERVDNTEKNIKIIGDFIKRQLKPNVDYGTIEYQSRKTGQMIKTKPFLMKPGSEKFAILFNHRAKFIWIKNDFEKGLFAAKCLLVNKANSDEVIGEGYGSAKVSEKAQWTENEAMKIACKRAQIDAALRTYGLSEYFTQDVEDMAKREPQRSPMWIAPTRTPYARPSANSAPMAPRNPQAPVSDPQMRALFKLTQVLGKDKVWLEKWIFDQAGVHGVENLTMGWASKFIDTLKKRADTIQNEDLPTITIDDGGKRDTDTSIEPVAVDVPEEEGEDVVEL